MPRLTALVAATCILTAVAGTARAQSADDRDQGDRYSGDGGSGGRMMMMDRMDHMGRMMDRGDDGDWRRWHREKMMGEMMGRDRGDRQGSRFEGDETSASDNESHPARFMLRSGDTRLAVQCASGESMKDCVQATIMLMDRARLQSRSEGSPTPSTPTPSPAPTPQQP